MPLIHQLWTYYAIQFRASRERDRDRGEISATTVVLAAALIALALVVGSIIADKVTDKANNLQL